MKTHHIFHLLATHSLIHPPIFTIKIYNTTHFMKHFLLLSACCLLVTSSYGQLVEIAVEPYLVHDGSIPALADMTTYRIYAVCQNASDEVSAVYGDATAPLSLTSTDGFYQDPLGANLAWTINPAFFAGFPSIEYDSWLTLGVTNQDEITGQPNTIGMDVAFDEFAAGGNLLVNSENGGSWFTLSGDTQAQAGDDLKVLIAQLTVSNDAVITGNFNVQIFVGGSQANTEQFAGIPFSSQADAVFGCMDPDAVNYNEDATESGETCIYPCALELTLAEVTPNACPESADGNLSVTATGAQLGVLFGLGENVPSLAVGAFGDLTGGLYTVNAVDGAGCEASIEVEVIAPDPIVIDASMTESVSCNGGSDAVISGSSTGGTGSVVYSLMENDVENGSDSLYFDGLAPGLYTVYAMDDNGCTVASSAISIANPQALAVSVVGGQNAISDATCADSEDGVVVLTTLGGSGTSAGMQFSTDGENFAPGNVLNLSGGTYTFYAMDVNGCIAATANEYTVGAPEAIVLSGSASGITCNGDTDGAVSFSGMGGVGALVFAFNGGADGDTTSFGDLAPGDYVVVATDELGCMAEATFTVPDIDAVTVTATTFAISCNGEMDGTVELLAQGGTNLYEYSADGTDFGSASFFDGLSPGTYTYYAQDSNGCSASVEATVEEPDVLTVTGTITNDSGVGDGALDITVEGGNGGYSFAWSGPDNFTSADEDLTGIVAGEYTVTITDANGCVVAETFGVPVGIGELTFLNTLTVSPNPSHALFNVTLKGATGEDVVLNAYDTQGRVVWSNSLNQAWGDVRSTIDLSGMAPGLYQLELMSSSGRHTVQLLKQ